METKNIAVAISHSPLSAKLIKLANLKLKKGFQAFCIYVETPSNKNLSSAQKKSLEKNISLAENLGFKFYLLEQSIVHQAIIDFVREKKVESLTIGSTRKYFVSGSNYNKIIQALPELEVNVIKLSKAKSRIPFKFRVSVKKTFFNLSLVALATGLIFFTSNYQPQIFSSFFSISSIYLFLILVAALFFSFTQTIITILFSTLAVDYFFVYPMYKFDFYINHHIIDFSFFVIFSFLIAAFTRFNRSVAVKNMRRNILNQNMLRLSNRLTGVAKINNVKKILEEEISQIFDTETYLLLNDNNNEPIITKSPKNFRKVDIEEAIFCLKESKKIDSKNYLFFPVTTKDLNIGVIAIDKSRLKEVDINTERLLVSICNLSALTIERIKLTQNLDDAENLKEKEKLRADLLSSVSHDLKTPLASIIGSLTAMEYLKDNLDTEAIDTLRKTAVEEAERLNQFITNILEMTKIESGNVKINKADYNFKKIAEEVTSRLSDKLSNYNLIFDIKNEEANVFTDKLLISQVLQNLLDNASKYSNSGSTITIGFEEKNNLYEIYVSDEGFGITDDIKSKIFDKFERIKLKDRKIAGTGLGLSICKSMIEILGGNIKVFNNKESQTGTGSKFIIFLNKVKKNNG